MGEYWGWIRESVALIDWAAVAALGSVGAAFGSLATLLVIWRQAVGARKEAKTARTIHYLERMESLRAKIAQEDDDMSSGLLSHQFSTLIGEIVTCREAGILNNQLLQDSAVSHSESFDKLNRPETESE